MYNRIIVIISNALPRETRSATVSFGGHISRVDTSFLNTVNVYPNPLRLHADAALNITGKDISRIQIYGIDGSMVCTFGKNPSLFRPIKKGFQWLPGNRTVPGIYRIYTENPDAVTGNKIKKLSKVLILP
jgi:hypothetical protein